MKVYEGKDIRNIGVVGHLHCGKTMLTSALLYTAGSTARLGTPEEGTTVTDFDEEEIQRHLTISTGLATAEWKKTKLNLFDTPGCSMFLQDTRSVLAATDSALVLVDAVAGVEVQTEKVHGFVQDLQLPHAFLVSRLDRERSAFETAVAGIQAAFGRTALPIQIPIGSEKNFRGVVDLLSMKAYLYALDGNGRGQECPIPEEVAERAAQGHEQLVELIAEGKDELMEEFFAQGTLSEEHMRTSLQEAIEQDRFFPILCASGARNVGTDLLLDFLADYFPAPLHVHSVRGTINGKEVSRLMEDAEPASVFVFKTSADPFAGRMSYFKVFSGIIHNDDHLFNVRSTADERLAHISTPMGKSVNPVTELHAGDIGVVAKLRDTLTGDTLAVKASPIAYLAPKAPEPSIAYAIQAKSRNDEDRMANAIHKILEEDPSLRFYRDSQTNEFLLGGCGQQHVEVIVSRLRRRYGVDVALHSPKIPYRETIRAKAEVQGRHKKQTGGHGQFGDCWIRMEPLERGAGFHFGNEIFGGSIPRNFVPAIEKGILEASARGVLAGFPVVDFKATVYDGSYHDVDSSEMAFKLAARKAFRAAMAVCRPALLEPVMTVETSAPIEYAGDLMADLNGRRGRILGMDMRGGTQVIRAHVPMSEMLNYQNDLVSMTQGRASFTMEFDHYDLVASAQTEKIVAAAKASQNGIVAEEDE